MAEGKRTQLVPVLLGALRAWSWRGCFRVWLDHALPMHMFFLLELQLHFHGHDAQRVVIWYHV